MFSFLHMFLMFFSDILAELQVTKWEVQNSHRSDWQQPVNETGF